MKKHGPFLSAALAVSLASALTLGVPRVTCAQDPIWSVGSNALSFPQSGGGSITSAALPTSFDPLIPNAYEYQGAAPLYSQNVQYDADGDVLFFVVDGNIYNANGLLLADNDVDPNCQVCMWKSTSRIAIVPVPGSCTRYFIVAGEDRTDRTDLEHGYIRLGVLDLTLQNDLSGYSLVTAPMGRFVMDSDAAWYDLLVPALGTSGLNLDPIEGLSGTGPAYVYEYELPNSYAGPSHEAVRFDVIQSGPGESRLMVIESVAAINFLLFPELGVGPDQAPVAIAGIDKGPYLLGDHYRSIRGEVEAKLVGSTLKVAASLESGDEDASDPYHELKIAYYEFNAALPVSLTLATTPVAYTLDQYFQSANQPQDVFGNVIEHPRVSGLEFSPSGEFVYFVKSCYSPAFDYNVGYIDTDLLPGAPGAVNELDLGTHDDSRKFADSELEINIAPTGTGQAIYSIRAENTTPATYFLDALTIPDVPATGNWSQVLPLQDIAVRGNIGDVQYRLLDSRIDACTHYAYLQTATEDLECCIDLAMTGSVEAGYTYSGTNTFATAWAPGSSTNPFLGAPAEVIFTEDFVVQNGATLYVNGMTWRFAPGKRLVVKTGGMVRFDNSLLTSLDCPGMRWPGVLVNGTTSNPSQGNTFQGRIYLYNNSEVSNAITGVWCATLNSSGVQLSSGFGGRVQAVNSTFRNNITGTRIERYHRTTPLGTVLPNFSNFNNCDFITDGDWPDYGVNVPLYHAQLKRVDLIKFTNCSFVNTNYLDWDPGQWGWGIYATTASVRCTGGMAYSTNRFSHLKIGAALFGPTPYYVNTIDGMGFFENVYGVLDQADWHARITNNRFDMMAGVALPPGEASVGLYIYQSELYTVERNLFFCDEDPYSPSVGIWFRGPAFQENVIYDNTFEQLSDGCVVQGRHRGLSPNPNLPQNGLQLLCGDHTSNDRDQVLLYGFSPSNISSIKGDQGTAPALGDLANNTFNNTPDCINTWEILVDGGIAPATMHVNYHYFDNGVAALRPECVDGTPVDDYYDLAGVSTSDPFDKEQHCHNGSLDFAGGSITEMSDEWEQKIQTLNSAIANYQETVDKNETKDIIADLKKDDPPYASYYLRDLLLGLYPLSDEVLIAAIKRDPPLDPWHLTQVLIQNSKVSQKVWDELSNGEYLPPYFITLLEEYDGEVNLRTLLEREISLRQTEAARCQERLLTSWMADTTSEGRLDSIDAMLAVDTSFLARAQRYIMAVANGNYDLAGTLEGSILSIPDAETMVVLGGLEVQLGGEWEEADSEDRSILLSTALDDQVYGSANAWGIALDLGLTDSLPPSYLPPVYRGSPRPGRPHSAPSTTPLLTAFPDPASDRVVLAFPAWATEGSVQIFDAQGRVVLGVEDLTDVPFAEIALDSFSEGIYLANLVLGGRSIGQAKFTVVK